MSIQYAIIDGCGCRMYGYAWQFDDDTYAAEITSSYSVWIVPGTCEVEDFN